jgi:transcriptional regulator with XRE-family HTH domain
MSGSLTAEERYRASCGQVFARLRARHGWSLREFGEHANAAHTTLYAIERGEAVPGIDILDRVAAACGIDLPAIMRMIIDGLQRDPMATPLTDLLLAIEPLTAAQRGELLSFIDYLRHRDRDQPT